MTLPHDSVSQARTWFAEMRKLTQYRSATDRVCDAEEALIKLLEREQRAPTGMADPDGFPPGGSGGTRGSATSTTTEAAALATLPNPDGTHPHIDTDHIGPLVLTAFDFTQQAGMSARTVRTKITEATKLSKKRVSLARTASMCESVGSHDEPCGELTVSRGLCDACRKWRDRHPDISVVPREIIDARKAKPRRTYETGPFAEEAS